MKYYIVSKDTAGQISRIEADDRLVIAPSSGDEILFSDEAGRPAKVDLSRVGNDLQVELLNGEEILVQGFFSDPEAEPVNLYLNDTSSAENTELTAYGLGNVTSAGEFSLLRLSNVDFQEPGTGAGQPLEELPGIPTGSDSGESFTSKSLSSSSISRQHEAQTVAESHSNAADQESHFNSPPTESEGGEGQYFGVAPDEVKIDEDDVAKFNILEGSELGNAMVFAIDGIPVCPGETIYLQNGAKVTVGEDGTICYDPSDSYQDLGDGEMACDQISYTTIGTSGETVVSTIKINICGSDEGPPEAKPDTAFGLEDTEIKIDVLANDCDPEGDPLEVCEAVADNGTVVIAADGSLCYLPDPDFHGKDTVTYTIKDPSGETSTTTVCIEVLPQNDPPAASDDKVFAIDKFPISVTATDLLGNDSDVDGDPLTIIGVGAASTGTVALDSEGSVSFTPEEGFFGMATFEYTVSDGKGGTDTATVTVCIEDTNEGPKAEDGCFECTLEPPNLIEVDGTFEDLAGVASNDRFNSNVTAGGWVNGQGSADSWLNMTTTGTGVWGGLADGMPASPDGGVFVAAGNWTTGGEALYTDITGLTIGETYTIKFYMANAGIEGTTPIGEETGWRVQFGGSEQFSPTMPYLGEGNQVWQEVEMTFVADGTTQRLQFFADDDGDPLSPGRSTEYVALDGVRVEAGDTTGGCDFNNLDITGNDSDADGDSLTIIALNGQNVTETGGITLPDGNTISINPNGTVNFDDSNSPIPHGDTTTFTYTISDGNGGTDTATITLKKPELPEEEGTNEQNTGTGIFPPDIDTDTTIDDLIGDEESESFEIIGTDGATTDLSEDPGSSEADLSILDECADCEALPDASSEGGSLPGTGEDDAAAAAASAVI